MSEGERMIDLTEAVAKAYVKNLHVSQRIDDSSVQLQVMSAICGNESCAICVTAYEPRWTDRSFFCNKNCPGDARVDKIINTLCEPVCVCTLDAFQESSVTFNNEGEITPGGLDAIVSDVREILSTKYGESFSPTRAQIEAILEGKTDQLITQARSAVQVIQISGNARVKNVRMSVAIDGVMKALADTSSKQIRNTVQSSIAQLKPFVEKAISRTINEILASFWLYWTILGAFIVTLIITWIVLKVVKK